MSATAEAPGAYYILTESDGPQPETRVLKHGETFAVFDTFGDITGAGGTLGLYHDGTRHLSWCHLRLAGHRPFLLSSSPGDSSHVLTVDLTNPDVRGDDTFWPKGLLHVRRTSVLWEAAWFTLVSFTNHGLAAMSVPVTFSFGADFRDVFEVRGSRRPSRGVQLAPEHTANGLVFGYVGLDGVTRRTVVQVEPAAPIDGEHVRMTLAIPPGQRREVVVAVTCSGQAQPPGLIERFDGVLAASTASTETVRSRLAGVSTSSDVFNEWLARSRGDLAMMVTQTPHGPYPYAGIPWFSTMFGRDGIITALSVLWADPSLARGVLRALAASQATTTDAERDAQPGKILHEARGGEMAALGEIPFGRYYGSVDATPLFVMLAGRYYERTGDLRTIEQLWPHVDAALSWIDRDGDVDGDGFVEYARATAGGLVHQGWKDSHDAVFHADGTLADGPIALSEVQSYVYAAKLHAADMSAALGDDDRARRLRHEAERLRVNFERSFWCDEIGTFALALDGRKRPCRVVSSNAAQCLVGGIADAERARRVTETTMRGDMYSGWGVRTIRDGEVRYNPMAYHNGSVWPHDTALVASGLARYGFKDAVVQLAEGMFAAAQQFELRRLPELFCGFPSRPGERPTRYPTACAPQAWSAAAVFLVVQAMLGIDVDGRRRVVTLRQPRLPSALEWVRVSGLTVGDAVVDLLCERRGDDVGASVVRRSGQVKVATEK